MFLARFFDQAVEGFEQGAFAAGHGHGSRVFSIHDEGGHAVDFGVTGELVGPHHLALYVEGVISIGVGFAIDTVLFSPCEQRVRVVHIHILYVYGVEQIVMVFFHLPEHFQRIVGFGQWYPGLVKRGVNAAYGDVFGLFFDPGIENQALCGSNAGSHTRRTL